MAYLPGPAMFHTIKTQNDYLYFAHTLSIRIRPENTVTNRPKSTQFAVPKCLFTNICGLAKTKNRVRAPVALEADLRSQDIDICVVAVRRLAD